LQKKTQQKFRGEESLKESWRKDY